MYLKIFLKYALELNDRSTNCFSQNMGNLHEKAPSGENILILIVSVGRSVQICFS